MLDMQRFPACYVVQSECHFHRRTGIVTLADRCELLILRHQHKSAFRQDWYCLPQYGFGRQILVSAAAHTAMRVLDNWFSYVPGLQDGSPKCSWFFLRRCLLCCLLRCFRHRVLLFVWFKAYNFSISNSTYPDDIWIVKQPRWWFHRSSPTRALLKVQCDQCSRGRILSAVQQPAIGRCTCLPFVLLHR